MFSIPSADTSWKTTYSTNLFPLLKQRSDRRKGWTYADHWCMSGARKSSTTTCSKAVVWLVSIYFVPTFVLKLLLCEGLQFRDRSHDYLDDNLLPWFNISTTGMAGFIILASCVVTRSNPANSFRAASLVWQVRERFHGKCGRERDACWLSACNRSRT